MAKTTAEVIREITHNHLTNNNGLMFGQSLKGAGWLGGTIPDCEGLVDLPITDIAGPGFAVGAALMNIRPIFLVRYQGFLWLNASPIINYASKSLNIWKRPCPLFIRAVGMEGDGIGPVASGCLHSVFMHPPGLKVVAPMTPKEYQSAWDDFYVNETPVFVSEHRISYSISKEMLDTINQQSKITIMAISAARINALEAIKDLEKEGIDCDMFHIVNLKPFEVSNQLAQSLSATKLGLVIDTDFETCGASQSIAYELMLSTGAKIHSYGLADRVSGVSKDTENLTPSKYEIRDKIKFIISQNEF
jgi:acetoin:2,6-dichlorophenolindophenol oxidoreductase subunit beta